MKKLSGPIRKNLQTNCTGRSEVFEISQFEVEPSDVGLSREHYLGYQCKSHKFAQDDVGQVIEVRSQGTGYTTWFFMKKLHSSETAATGS